METYPFVQIVWWDAEDFRRSWGDIEDAKDFAEEPCEVVSYGYLLAQTKAYVVIGADRILQENNQHTGTTFGRITKIPRPWIRSFRKTHPRKARR